MKDQYQRDEEHALDPKLEELPPKFYDDPLDYPAICVVDFSPSRDAQHNIDLIVDSINPNKATYCVNSKVHRNMLEQEEKLPIKEWVMESLRPNIGETRCLNVISIYGYHQSVCWCMSDAIDAFPRRALISMLNSKLDMELVKSIPITSYRKLKFESPY